MKKNKFLTNLRALAGSPHPIRIERTFTKTEYTDGFVLDVRRGLLQFLVLGSSYYLDGISIFSLSDIDRYRKLTERAEMLDYVLRYRHGDGYLSQNGCKFGGLKEFSFKEIHQHYPLVTIHREHIDPGVCNIGRVVGITKKKFELEEIDPNGEWDERTERYRFKDITQVSFGGRYEEALWMYANREKTSTP